MILHIAAFTDRGEELAKDLGEKLGGAVFRCGRNGLTLDTFTASAFASAQGIIFVGAVGIAVRAIAPYLRHKSVDPAVVVVDEAGQFAIPVLSGHLGGANALAREVALRTGAVPVITTATDVRGVFAIDEWARVQGCRVLPPEGIRRISGALLRGETVSVLSEFPISGNCPEGVTLLRERDAVPDAALTIHRQNEKTLCIVPPVVVLGIGCKAGTPERAIEDLYQEILEAQNLLPEAICGVATIDVKKAEAGLAAFCQKHGLPLRCFPADALNAVAGSFSGSEFVQKTVGTDNVCERSAVCLSGGRLILKKTARKGVTMAAAVKPFCPDWSWNHE